MDKGTFDDLRHFVCRFQALKGPLRAPWGPQQLSMDKLVCGGGGGCGEGRGGRRRRRRRRKRERRSKDRDDYHALFIQICPLKKSGYGPTYQRTDQRMDRWTDRRMDRQTDKASYRDARTHLKIPQIIKYSFATSQVRNAQYSHSEIIP